MLLVIWVVMITGFGLDMVKKAALHKLEYPMIIHAHAVVFTGWLVLFAVQILLIRKRDYKTHMKLGILALVLLPLMIILGPAAAIARGLARIQAHMADSITNHTLSFMSTQFTNVLGASVLIVAALLLRKDASSHKRLMLMGTVALTEPGFSRFLVAPLSKVFGDGVWPYIIETYIGTIGLVFVIGAYDLMTRKRLHQAYIWAALWIFANEFNAAWLFYQPGWLAFIKHLIGH